ncbi:MAG TPA: hypothetical protein VJA94_17895 [Candidatus Angelobacter sp.]
MLHKLIPAFLLLTVAAAQTSLTPDHPATILRELSESQPLSGPTLLISTYQRYDSLRRGREQEIAVVVCMVPGRYHYCPDYGSPNHTNIEPVAFELIAEPGFQVRYRSDDDYQSQTQGTPLQAGDKQLFLLRLRAADNLLTGTHVLTAHLILRKGDQGPGGVWKGNGILEQMEFRIPITVVDHDAQVSELTNWPRHPGHNVGGIIRDFAEMVGSVALEAFCNAHPLACLRF